jgi:gluconate 2-dehydrogenase gamma chain
MSRSLTRRRFLELGASSAAVTALVCGGCRRDRAEPPKLAALTEAEYAATVAACDRILPRDEDPGASDLGVADYIDRALATDLTRWRDRFRAGLRALDSAAQRRGGGAFCDASASVRDNILDDWQDGSREQAEFVRMLVNLTLEGAFGDPAYGGNRGSRGWQLIGFAPCEPRHHAAG